MAAVGPQDLLLNATAGASYGYALLWTVALIVVSRFTMMEASARYVVVTGETLMSGYARAGRWVPWMMLVSILLKRHLTTMLHILALGSGIHLIAPLPTGSSTTIWALASCAAGVAVMYWGKYRFVERCSKPLAFLLGAALVLAAVLARPDAGAVLRGAAIPSFPEGYGYSYALVLLALIGAGAGGMGNLKYAAFVHEKGWGSLRFLQAQRKDLLLSGAGMYLMVVLIQVAAAAVLYPATGALKSVDDLVPLFHAVAGDSGRIVLGLGLWAAAFTTYIGANTGYALLVSDIYYNVIRRPPGQAPGTAVGGHSERPAYRWSILWFCISPLYVLLTDWQLLPLVLISSALTAVLLPATVIVMLWLTSNRRLMGEAVNGWFTNALMVLLTAATVFLAGQNAMEMWSSR